VSTEVLDRDDGLILAVAALLALVFMAAELRIAGDIGLPLDDSWIHLRFADNLSAGHGFAINPGVPVAASTAPLWTLLLALAIALGVPGLWAAKALGLAAYAASGLLTRRLALAIGLTRGLALAAGIGVVGLGRMAWGALSGMEVPLAAALVAAGSLLAARDRGLAAAATLGAATLARPEAGLLAALHAAGARRPGAAAARLAVTALVVAPALAFNLATVGQPVPSTALAKIDGGVLGWLNATADSGPPLVERLGRVGAGWLRLLSDDHLLLPALLLVGLIARRRSRLGWLPWVLLLHPVAMAVIAPSKEPGFQTGRYVAHLIPLEVVVAVAGLGVLRAMVPPRFGLRAGVMAVAALGLVLPLGPAAEGYAWGVQNINAMQVRLGRWVARTTPPEAVLAVNDIGALTYFGQRRVIDLVGLATPDILPERRRGETALLGYLERACPDYLVIFPRWYPELAARNDLFRPVERVVLDHNVVAGADEMVVYETAWNRRLAGRRACPPRS
jgi:arabinofuranosyltransferase